MLLLVPVLEDPFQHFDYLKKGTGYWFLKKGSGGIQRISPKLIGI
tara:strand:+ start:311 stop:445 length:135 start_codon:yes stop_codon:yes gene_type:complete